MCKYLPRFACSFELLIVEIVKKAVPHILTSGNLFCGSLAAVFAVQGLFDYVFWLVIIAAVLDVFDGAVARALGVQSEFGVQLDSLADMVTFGLVPGIVLFQLLQISFQPGFQMDPLNLGSPKTWLPYFGFLITVFSALRLAMFNIDTEQTSYFRGLPTPANTLFIISLPMILKSGGFLHNVLFEPFTLLAIAVLSSALLVSRIPLFSLKVKSPLHIRDYTLQIALIGISVVIIPLFGFTAIPIILFLYLILSVLFFRPVSKAKRSNT